MNTFEMKTAIHFGDNALDRLKEIPYKRVLIITDPFVVQSKMINLITAPLNSAGIEYDISMTLCRMHLWTRLQKG